MRLLAFLSALTVATQACAADKVPESKELMYQEQVLVKPSIGFEGDASIGSVIIDQRTGEYRYCVVPKFSESPKDFMGVDRFTVKSGIPICREAEKEKKYTAEYPNMFNTMGNQSTNALVNYKVNGDNFKLCAQTICTSEKPLIKAYVGPYFIDAYESHRMSILYSSKEGDTLTFTFHETVKSENPQDFSRDIKVDLSKTKFIEFRGLKIEIISATEDSIKYRVDKSFN
jgi:hypothetical protein